MKPDTFEMYDCGKGDEVWGGYDFVSMESALVDLGEIVTHKDGAECVYFTICTEEDREFFTKKEWMSLITKLLTGGHMPSLSEMDVDICPAQHADASLLVDSLRPGVYLEPSDGREECQCGRCN